MNTADSLFHRAIAMFAAIAVTAIVFALNSSVSLYQDWSLGLVCLISIYLYVRFLFVYLAVRRMRADGASPQG